MKKMKIVFFTNTLNNHQISIADELYCQSNGDYVLVETEALKDERRQMGFLEYERQYKLKAYESEANRQAAMELARNADVAIMGANSFPYLEERIKKGGKLTFSFSERWLKKGVKSLFSPRLLKLMRLYHLQGGKRQPWYVLCASAYLASDLIFMKAFKNRCYKYGYFTQVQEININAIIAARQSQPILKILWVARYLKWKHPDVMLTLAEHLKKANVKFEINMVGTGDLYDTISEKISSKKLSNNVHQLGSMSNSNVLSLMREHHIFCMTSDRNEGWGAVLGEAMSNGCCPVSSVAAGATPFLIKDGINGYSFDLRKNNDLFNKIMLLVNNPKLRERMSKNAYSTMHDSWNSKNAAKKLLILIKELTVSDDSTIMVGPCSKV